MGVMNLLMPLGWLQLCFVLEGERIPLFPYRLNT